MPNKPKSRFAPHRSQPQLMHLSSREVAFRLLELRTAMPATNVSIIVRKRPQLLLDAVSLCEHCPHEGTLIAIVCKLSAA